VSTSGSNAAARWRPALVLIGLGWDEAAEAIQEGAGQGIVPMLDHLGHGPITAADQALAKRVAIHPLVCASMSVL